MLYSTLQSLGSRPAELLPLTPPPPLERSVRENETEHRTNEQRTNNERERALASNDAALSAALRHLAGPRSPSSSSTNEYRRTGRAYDAAVQLIIVNWVDWSLASHFVRRPRGRV